MKRLSFLFYILFILIGSVGAQQTTNTDYFVHTSQTRSMMNPAFRPDHGYIGIPGLSNIFIDVKTNTLNLDHLTFKKNGYSNVLNFMHPDITPYEFLKNMSDNNYASSNVSVKILSAGFYAGAAFWTIDLNVRAQAEINVPKSFFNLMKSGFSSDITADDDPIRYDLKNIGAAVNAFTELAVGHSRDFLDNSLQVGARSKLLFGIGNFDLNIDRFDVEYGYEKWTAVARASLSGSLTGLKPTYDEDGIFDGFDIDDNGISLSGWGLGLDIGAVYDFKNISENIDINFLSYFLSRTKLSLAFTDIGFISWSKNNSVNLTSPDAETIIDFDNFNFNDDGSLADQFESVFTDLEEAFNFKEKGGSDKRTTTLRTNMNIGLEYEVWKDNMTIGLLSSTQFEAIRTVSEFTLSANYNPLRVKWLAASLSYSFVHSRFNTFGFALHLAPSKGVNFFLASDYTIPHVNTEFIPTTSKAVNVQLGFSVPMGRNNSDKMKKYIAEKKDCKCESAEINKEESINTSPED